MPVKKLLKYILNLNWLEDRNEICYCCAEHDAINISHKRGCCSSDMKVVLTSQ